MARHPINEARAARRSKAEAVADLVSGRLGLVQALQHPPASLNGADLYEVLMAAPGLGRESVRVVCERAGVWPHVRLADIETADRQRLVAALPARACRSG